MMPSICRAVGVRFAQAGVGARCWNILSLWSDIYGEHNVGNGEGLKVIYAVEFLGYVVPCGMMPTKKIRRISCLLVFNSEPVVIESLTQPSSLTLLQPPTQNP